MGLFWNVSFQKVYWLLSDQADFRYETLFWCARAGCCHPVEEAMGP